jgi:hypothetical protein
MKTSTLVLLAILFALPATAETANPCLDPEMRRLDYWVGDWDVVEADARDKVVAHAVIERVVDGCGLREVYEQEDGLRGQSLSTWDATRKVWHQTWITNRGQLLVIEGTFLGDRLSLQGTRRAADGQESLLRGIWVPEDGGVRQTAHTSADGGRTWQPLFDMFFRRRAAATRP